MVKRLKNFDSKTIASFGDEWRTHHQQDIAQEELQSIFHDYFDIFPWPDLPSTAIGFDMGCGSGRWAKFVAPHVDSLICIDASDAALDVAKNNLAGHKNVQFFHATTETVPIPPESCDFGYSLGVLHHIPDTQAAMQDCVCLLKQGAPFLVYLYYKFDNRPVWYRVLWQLSDLMRKTINRLSDGIKTPVTNLLALTVYWPLARLSWLLERLGCNVSAIPLSTYRNLSFSTMKTDSRDRFGTPLEQRFTRNEIKKMMEDSGLEKIHFSDKPPFWCAVGRKRVSVP